MGDYDLEMLMTRYQMVPRTLILIEKNSEFLLIEKVKSGTFGFGKLNGVGGHIEQGEDAYNSARREIMEETGLEVGLLDLAAILFIDINESPGIEVFVFHAKYAGGVLRSSPEGNLLWLGVDQIRCSPAVVKDIPFLLEIVCKHKKGQAPEIVRYSYDNKGELRIAISDY